MRRVADKRDAMGNEFARNPKAERKHAARADRRDLPEGEAEAALERELQQQLFVSDDAREGIAAYVDKRPPSFKGR